MEAYNKAPEMGEYMYSFVSDSTCDYNRSAWSPLDFPGGYNMFETEFGDWDTQHDHVDNHPNEERGKGSSAEQMEGMRELGTRRMDGHDNGNGQTNQYHALTQSNLAAAPREQPPASIVSNYDEVFDGMLRNGDALRGQYEVTEIMELAHIAPAAETNGPGVHHIIARQALDAISAVSNSQELSCTREPTQIPASLGPRNFGAGFHSFSDSHPPLIGSHLMQKWPVTVETASTNSGVDAQSEAVFSDSSRVEQATSITSLEHSRRRTNSTQSARPQLEVRNGTQRRDESAQSRPSRLSQISLKLQCHHCGKEFDIQSKLKKHARYHLQGGNRPHKCEHCIRDFADLRDLRRHMSKLHPEHPMNGRLESWNRVKCECCDKSCSRRDILLRHIAQEPETCGEYYKQKAAAAGKDSHTSSTEAMSNDQSAVSRQVVERETAMSEETSLSTIPNAPRSITASGEASQACTTARPSSLLCPSMGYSRTISRSRSSMNTTRPAYGEGGYY